MIPLFKVNMPASVIPHVESVLMSGFIADGDKVQEFEKSLASYIGNPNVVSVNSEASGMMLALYLAGVGPGDIVIASPVACTASTMPILNLFAKVVWSDVNPISGMLDPVKLESIIRQKEKIKAIIHTHWGGDVGEIERINEIAKKYNIMVIDDATEAFGAKYREKHLGALDSDFVVYSFGPIKHFSTTDGGAIFFKNQQLMEQARNLKRFGIDRATFRDNLGEISISSDIPKAGYNFYMNNVCASIGINQLQNIESILNIYYRNGRIYQSRLMNTSGIEILERNSFMQPSYWVFTLLADRRDDLLKALRSRGIYASKIHLRNDMYSCYGTGLQESLIGVKYFSEHDLCIPCGWWVTEDDANKIVESIKMGW